MTSAPLLEIDDVSLRVGDSALEIVKRASFSIRAGEILGIVGESGSAKPCSRGRLWGWFRRPSKQAMVRSASRDRTYQQCRRLRCAGFAAMALP